MAVKSNFSNEKDNSCIVCIHKFCVTLTSARVLKFFASGATFLILSHVAYSSQNAGCVSACEAMEQQLQSLGKRWAAICHWTEEQWLLLQNVLLKWQSFADDRSTFGDWLMAREDMIEKMTLEDLADTNVAVKQVQDLKVRTRQMKSWA